MPEPLRIGLVGAGWMGHAHARAYARVQHHYPELGAPRLVALADPDAGQRHGLSSRIPFEREHEDWRAVVADPGIDVVSVTTPTFLHAEIATAVAEAGKHLWVEKPVGLSLAETEAVADAVGRAGVHGRVGYNYRLAPAVVKARRLIEAGEIGEPTHVRVRLFSDYAAHPGGVLSWRFEAERGGDGVIGDLLSHGIDLVRILVGEVDRLVADGNVFIASRPLATGAGSHYAVAEGGPQGPVENLDHLGFLARTTSGVSAHVEGTRVGVGDQNNYGFEVRGTRGQVSWDFRRMGELQVSSRGEYANQPVTTSFVGPGDGDYGLFQPGAGIAMSYDDLKVIECADLLGSVLGTRPESIAATTEDARSVSAVMDAVRRSHDEGAWVPVTGSAG